MSDASASKTKAMEKAMKDLLKLAVEHRQEEDEWAFAITEASREITWALGIGVMLYVTPRVEGDRAYFETSYARIGDGEKFYPDGTEFRLPTGDYYKAEDALEGAVKAFTNRAHGHSVREAEKRYEEALRAVVRWDEADAVRRYAFNLIDTEMK